MALFAVIVLTLHVAGAAPVVDGTLRAGARTAPESTIQVPAGWEGRFDPSGLLAADLAVRLGTDEGAWGRAAIGAWGYAPDLDASMVTGSLGLGWGDRVGKSDLSVAGRYDGQVLPGLIAASNGRAEAVASASRTAGRWTGSGQATLVDRRFAGELGLSTAEIGPELDVVAGIVGLDVGASGQVNTALETALGEQARTLLRLKLAAGAWRVSVDHRFLWATGGAPEEEERAALTLAGDYADDLDALSGGGFLQQRVGFSAAVAPGAWTLSAGGFARFRSSQQEAEAAVAAARTWSAHARLQRRLGPRIDGFVVAGAAGASRAAGDGYLDAYGWVGVDLHRGTSLPARGRKLPAGT